MDELFDTVRIGKGLEATGELKGSRMRRAIDTLEMYAHFCRATGVETVLPVATSAIRDATNQKQFLARAREETGLRVRVLAPEAEARYGYLAAVNTTTIADGVVLEIGGGSLQLVRVAGRLQQAAKSWPLGAVRMTERFLPDRTAGRKQLRALRSHIREELESAEWLPAAAGAGGRLVGVGGAVRNLAAAAEHASGLPSFGVQGFVLGAEALEELIGEFERRPADERGRIAGIKPERGDVILAGAIVIAEVLAAGGFNGVEVTEAGLREGVFFEQLLGHPGQDALFGDEEPPLFEDVRRAGVRNLAAQYLTDFTHAEHVAGLSLQIFAGLADAGVHKGDPGERDLLWAAAMLHDIGTAVDYDDHHKHSRYLILNAGLPGYSPRETALLGQMARYHRKGTPQLGEYAPLMRTGDAALLNRCSAILRLAEQLERARDQLVRSTHVEVSDGRVRLNLVADGDVAVARWGAERQRDVFARAFGHELDVVA